MLDAVIFDMDGTIFQTNKILEIALEDAFEYLRLNNKWEDATPIELYRDIMGVPLPKVWETLMPVHSLEDRKEMDAYFLSRLIYHIEAGHGALYEHVETVFSYIKSKGMSIYIASNGLVNYLAAIVNYYKLNNWVTETFSIEKIESLNKSDLVACIIEKYNITSGIVVGDRLSDILAAKDNNLIAVGCHFDFAKTEELMRADYVIKSLIDLKLIVDKYN